MKWMQARYLGGALCVLLAGCAGMSDKKATQAPTYDQLMEQAEGRIRAQDIDGARVLFNKATQVAPTRKEPWFRLAQLDFNQQNYGGSIVAAQEVLQRDASDVDAESILTVSGLRVAVDALGRLQDESNTKGPAHLEAEKLAQKLRDTLGEDVLVPPKKTRPARRRSRPAAPAAAADGTTPAPAATPAAPAAPEGKAASSNPFQGLPGSGGQ